jgi:predicted  nucleic acid-binding Zn-ribbon protein
MAPYLRPLRTYARRTKGSIISAMYGLFGTAKNVREARGEYDQLEERREKLVKELSTSEQKISSLDEEIRRLANNLDASLALLSDYQRSYSNTLDIMEKNTSSINSDLDKLTEFVKKKNEGQA